MNTIIILSLLVAFIAEASSTKDHLLHLSYLFRHGDRTPAITFINDKYQDAWPRGLGQLTPRGQKQHFNLGKAVRGWYSRLFKPDPNKGLKKLCQENTESFVDPFNDVYVRSTNVDRTLMSAQSHLAGLFKPDQEWNSFIPHWQPLPVHTLNFKHEEDFLKPFSNPRFSQLVTEQWDLSGSPKPEIVEELTQYKDLWMEVLENAGYDPLNITNLSSFFFIADTLLIEDYYNATHPPPSWATDEVMERMKVYQDLDFSSMVNNEEQIKLGAGKFLAKIIEDMDGMIEQDEKKLTKNSRRKFYKMNIYSAHDTTVTTLLAALKVFNKKAPPYASAVFLELWSGEDTVDQDQQPYVVIKYRNDTSLQPLERNILTIPGCEEKCPLVTFKELLQDHIVKQDENKAIRDADNKIPWKNIEAYENRLWFH